MFDFDSIIELLKVEPGHGFIQSILLAMIWWSSRGVRKEIHQLGENFTDMKSNHELRLNNIEGRLTVLEKPKGE